MRFAPFRKSRKPGRGSPFALLTHNFGWKLGSLLMAVLLWFAIIGEPELVTTHTFPILYRNLPPDLLIGADAADVVRVELRGPSSRLSAADLADESVILDLSGAAGAGERTFTLSGEDLHLPEGVTFLRAVPSQLRLQLARRKTKTVSVHVRIGTPPPAGYRVTGQEVVPRMLEIAGPELRVDSIDSAETDAIDLNGITGVSEVRVNTYVPDPRVWLESSPIVTVRLTVEKIK